MVPEIALAKVREDAPFDKICYIGCGVTTGIGAVIYTAKVEQGPRAIAFGLGGTGLNVIPGLRLAGADQIVGVDMNPSKKPMAEKFGMTDFVNPKEVEGDLVPYLVDLTKGGADYTFDATGNVEVMRAALESAHKGWGESVIIGVAPAGAGASLAQGRRLVEADLDLEVRRGLGGCGRDEQRGSQRRERKASHGRDDTNRFPRDGVKRPLALHDEHRTIVAAET